MIEKIVITDEKLEPLFYNKISLLDSLDIISSVNWLGETLLYTRGRFIYYFYPFEEIDQKVFTSDQNVLCISGVVSDRIFLTAKNDFSQAVTQVLTPIINILEPLLIGYMDSPNVDWALVKEAVQNLFTNQISQNLVEKLLKYDLKEVCWMLLNDTKCSYQNLEHKIKLINDLLKFEYFLDTILPNKNLKNEVNIK